MSCILHLINYFSFPCCHIAGKWAWGWPVGTDLEKRRDVNQRILERRKQMKNEEERQSLAF
jgi:hypothetical protein